MKHTKLIKMAAVLGVGAAVMAPAAALADEIVSSSFGAAGICGSADFVAMGSFHCIAGRPAVTPAADTYLQSGPHAVQFPMIMSEPIVHLISSAPGEVTLVCVPDLPGRVWTSSDDLTSWSFLADSSSNPLVMEVAAARRFFRLEQP